MGADDQNNNKWKEFLADDADLPEEDDELTADAASAEEEELSEESPVSVTEDSPQVIVLKEALSKAQEEILLREAKVQNIASRSQREMRAAKDFANEKLLTALLPVLDSFDRALAADAAEDSQAQSMFEGMLLTRDMFMKVLVEFGVQLISPEIGEIFDPQSHEAVSVQAVADTESQTIVQVLQPGYRLNGRVVRAAMVIVAQ